MTGFTAYKRKILLFLIPAVLGYSVPVPAETAEEYEVKTALILNLALFTEWPDGTFDGPHAPINLCVIGDNVVQEAFTGISGKKVGRREINVSDITRSKKIDNCHIVFLGDQDRIRITQIQAAAIGKPILTIDDINGLTSFNSIINLQKGDNKMQLNINLKLAEQSRLKISSRVLKLARIVS